MNLPQAQPDQETSATAILRVTVAIAVGLVGGLAVGLLGSWKYAPLAVWDLAAVTFLLSIWVALHGRDAQQTANLAVREDPSHAAADVLLVLASIASLAAVGVLLAQAGKSSGVTQILEVGLGIASVVASWAVVHLVFALRYARIYYSNKGGINFNSDQPPQYSDFAYLAFTIGMTFQVSDTAFTTSELRRIALRHAVLSYLFGTVIVATTINLIAGLGK
jgi:uncharacterized membrane protein